MECWGSTLAFPENQLLEGRGNGTRFDSRGNLEQLWLSAAHTMRVLNNGRLVGRPVVTVVQSLAANTEMSVAQTLKHILIKKTKKKQ